MNLLLGERELRRLLSDITLISNKFKLSDKTKVDIKELDELIRGYFELSSEIEKLGIFSFMKKKKLKEKQQKILETISATIPTTLRSILNDVKPFINRLNELYEKASPIVKDKVKYTPMTLSTLPSDPIALVEYIHNVVNTAVESQNQLRNALLSIVQDLWKSNNLKFNIYRKYIALDADKVRLSSSEIVESEDIDTLIDFYYKLKKEEEFLDALKMQVRISFQEVLKSRLENLEAYLGMIEGLGIIIKSSIKSKIESLRNSLKEPRELSSLQSLEKEINELEEVIKDDLRREIIKLKNETISATEKIPNLPPEPEIIGESIDKLIEGYQAIRTWHVRVVSTIIIQIKDLLKDADAALGKLSPDLADPIKRKIENIRNRANKVTKLEEAVSLYWETVKQIENWKELLFKEIQKRMGEYNRTLQMIKEVIERVPSFLVISLPEDISGASLSFLANVLYTIRTKTEQRDKVFKDAIIGELNSFKSIILSVPEEYQKQFENAIKLIDSTIEKIRATTNTEEIRLHFIRTRAELEKEIGEILQGVRDKQVLKIRLMLAKMPGAPDVSDAINQIMSLPIDITKPGEYIIKINSIMHNQIVNRLKDFLMKEVSDYLDILNILKEFNLDFSKEREKLLEISKKLADVKDAEGLGDLGREFRVTITNKDFINVIKNWIETMTTSMSNALSELGRGVTEAEGIATLIRESKTVDPTNPAQLVPLVKKLVKVWELIREYIIKIEDIEYSKFLEAAKSYNVYETVMKIYEIHKDEFSEKIFPLLTLEQKREMITKIKTPELVEILQDIRKLEKDFLEKLKEISVWHKAVRILMAGFDFSAPESELKNRVKEIKKNIRKMYKREDIISYLEWVVEYLASRGGQVSE